MIVKLSEAGMNIARGYGRLRNEANRKLGRRDNKTKGFDGESINVLGVAGEMAVHIATGIKWTGRYVPASKLEEWLSKPQPDLGTDIEVRTASKPSHHLLVHRNDPDEWRYVLVRKVAANEFDIVGWAYGHEVKQKKYWRGSLPYPAYSYPTGLLRPVEELT